MTQGQLAHHSWGFTGYEIKDHVSLGTDKSVRGKREHLNAES